MKNAAQGPGEFERAANRSAGCSGGGQRPSFRTQPAPCQELRRCSGKWEPVRRGSWNCLRGEVGPRIALAVLVCAGTWGPNSSSAARQSAAGQPLDLQITQVNRLMTSSDERADEVEIRWVARVPRSAIIDGFDVFLDVRYSDGSHSSARSESLKPSERSTVLNLPAHRRPNSAAVLRSYHARVKAKFKVGSSITVVHHVTPEGRGGSRAGGGGQPDVLITGTKMVDACADNQRCVEVRWSVNSPRAVLVEGFAVAIDAEQKNGEHATSSATAGGGERLARLSLGPVSSEVLAIRATLVASFSSADSRTAFREGEF